ncbi:MAG: hypothetical protein ACLR3X_10640 [Intestinibacter bartlettii]
MNKKSIKDSTPMYIGSLIISNTCRINMISVTLGSAKSQCQKFTKFRIQTFGIKAYSEY